MVYWVQARIKLHITGKQPQWGGARVTVDQFRNIIDIPLQTRHIHG